MAKYGPPPAFLPLGACLLALSMALTGCASKPALQRAPVEEQSPVLKVDRKPLVAEQESHFYVVQKGDTLSRVAAKHKVSVADLTSWNNLSDPNRVEVDQRLRIVAPTAASVAAAPGAKPAVNAATPQPVAAVAPVEGRPLPPATGQSTAQPAAKPAPAASPAPAQAATPIKPASGDKHEPVVGKQAYSEQNLAKARASAGLPPLAPPVAPEGKAVADGKAIAKPADTRTAAGSLSWAWPAPGKVVKAFNGNSNKGVDVTGQPGDPVLAAATGKVIYAGPALRGTGRLVIVKHPGQFLSVYEHSGQTLVKEGQAVTQGQKLAEMGKAESGSGMVHFEIRQQGKPVDPQKVLPSRE